MKIGDYRTCTVCLRKKCTHFESNTTKLRIIIKRYFSLCPVF